MWFKLIAFNWVFWGFVCSFFKMSYSFRNCKQVFLFKPWRSVGPAVFKISSYVSQIKSQNKMFWLNYPFKIEQIKFHELWKSNIWAIAFPSGKAQRLEEHIALDTQRHKKYTWNEQIKQTIYTTQYKARQTQMEKCITAQR